LVRWWYVGSAKDLNGRFGSDFQKLILYHGPSRTQATCERRKPNEERPRAFCGAHMRKGHVHPMFKT